MKNVIDRDGPRGGHEHRGINTLFILPTYRRSGRVKPAWLVTSAEQLTNTGAAVTGQPLGRAGRTIQLLTAVHDGIRAPGLIQPGMPGGDRLLPPMLTVIRHHIGKLRRLDDRAGGGAVSLRYVRAELRAVLDLLRHTSFDAAVGQQLLAAAAELCQLAGWMWFDGGDIGRSQRTFLLGIRLARAAVDDDVLANMLGMLAYITAHGGEPQQALRLAEHAGPPTRTDAALPHRRTTGHGARRRRGHLRLPRRRRRRAHPPGGLLARRGPTVPVLPVRLPAARGVRSGAGASHRA